MRKYLIIAALLSLTACETLTGGANLVLDKARTLGAAVELKNQSEILRDNITVQFDQFSAEDQLVLASEYENVEAFYLTLLRLSSGGDANTILINSGEFLGLLTDVRRSVDAIIYVVEPNVPQLSPDTVRAFYAAESNYRVVSARLDETLARGNRREVADMVIKALRAAIPLVASVVAK